ncbi:MAG: hypothetical protein JNK30_13435, partial [Phenylobacterium sp.]|nr:hypothetical protein [Phenylobacterium sp.]
HGRFEGYAPSAALAAPAEGVPGELHSGRTTIDGIPLAKILADRPDVFQAYFTEYYGPNNDRHSDAWVQRVGGTSLEDYADYWYNAHGRTEGYAPSGPPPAANAAEPPATTTEPPPAALEPLPAEDPSLDPWNHPAIYPDWRPPYPGWRPPGEAPADPAGAEAPVVVFARPLVVHYREDGVDLLPATDEELARMRSLFDDAVF